MAGVQPEIQGTWDLNKTGDSSRVRRSLLESTRIDPIRGDTLETGNASDPRNLEQAGPEGRGYFDGDEAVGGEQIILAALVDDAQVAIPLGVLVGKHGVDLVALE
jgi:hypothetical protein